MGSAQQALFVDQFKRTIGAISNLPYKEQTENSFAITGFREQAHLD